MKWSKSSLHCSNINHVLAEIYSSSDTFIEMWKHLTELGVVAAELVMKCLPVKRADISGNCIWGANLAALTTWPYNPSIPCVSAENTSAHTAACNHTRMGTCIQRRHTTWWNCQASRTHVQTTDHNCQEHESRLLIVFSEPKKNTPQRLITSTNRRQTWRAEEQTTRRTVHQHHTCTQRASMFLK